MPNYVVLNSAKLQDTGEGSSTFASGRDKPSMVYHDKGGAINAAEQLARQNPQNPIFIMEVVDVIETAEPKFVHKKFNSSGEMIPT